MSDGDPPDADADDSDAGRYAERRIEPPRLKDLLAGADDTHVPDRPAGLPRLNWDAVTDTGGAPTDRGTPARPPAGDSSFQFDLGGALARLAGDGPADEHVAETPRHADPVPPSHESVPPVAEPIPERRTEPFVAPPSPTRPPAPSLVTRPIEPMTYESVVREPSTPPPAPSRPTVDHAPDSTSSHVDEVASTPPQAYPRRVPGTHLESHMRPEPDALPEIREATPADAAPRPVVRSSVFDDLSTGSAAGAAPSLPSTAPGLPGTSASPAIMPVLPASNPAAPPPVAAPVSNAPSTPDINALRSAQLRASKQQRQGRMFGRSLLAFVVIGGMIAAALVFGRSLLFDTQWDAQLTPIVNEIESERGPFDRPVPLVVVPAAELGDRLVAATIGEAWVDRVPEWRALGLATGSADAASIGAALAASTTAVYDPTSDRIYQLDGVDAADGAADLRVALERAFDAQVDAVPAADAADTGDADATATDAGVLDGPVGTGLTGVSSLESIATRAVDEVLASGGAARARESADGTLPIPIAYELAAVEVLGESILFATGLDPSLYEPGDPYPDRVATVLDEGATAVVGALIQPGEVALAAPQALGTDDWSLVWGARLPAPTVDQLVGQVVADTYRPVSRAGSTCFVAVFDTADEASGSSVLAALTAWAANAPVASQALATSVAPTRVQLEACDPGADTATVPNPGVADALIDRQQRRLTN